MAEVWIANASPVIALAKCNYIAVVDKLCDELILPHAVVAEITAGPANDPARKLIETGWGNRATPSDIPPRLLEWSLGPGETSVLALALERSTSVSLLDDAAARACAKVVGVPVLGTLGIIVRAKKYSLLRSAREAMLALRQFGLYLDDDIVRRALQHVGETWDT